VDHVKWFRERANQDHHREETETLEADFEQTIFSHARMVNVWSQLAGRCSQEPGATVYAWKKVEMYRNLSTEASNLYEDAKQMADKADKTSREC
jgi:hypothetical protein